MEGNKEIYDTYEKEVITIWDELEINIDDIIDRANNIIGGKLDKVRYELHLISLGGREGGFGKVYRFQVRIL